MKVTKKILGLLVIGCTAVASFTSAFSWTNIYVGDTETTYLDYTQTPTNSANFGFSGDNVQRNIFFMKNGEGMNGWNTKVAFYYWTDLGLAFYSNSHSNYAGLISGYYISTYGGYINFTRELNKNSSTRQLHSTWQDVANLGLEQGDINVVRYATTEGNINFGNAGVLAICFASITKDIEVCTVASQEYGTNRFTHIDGKTITGTYGDQSILSPSLIHINYLKNSPFTSNSGGGTGTGETGTGTQKYCPPIRYEIDMYGYKYNTGLCYSNTEEISGGQVITVTPISIFDAFPTYQAYVQAYNLVTNNCHTSTVNTVEQCQTALQTIGKKPSQILLKLINSNIQEGVSLSKIYQYCHLQLDYTEEEKWNKSTCDLKEDDEYYATGVNQNSESNPNPIQGMTDQLQDSTDIIIPEDGTIFDSILPDGILSWKDVVFDFNFWKNLTTLISKMIVLFKVRPIQTGILPPLITSLLLLIILFKIYKK